MFFRNRKDEIKKEDLIPRKDYDKLKNLVDVHQDYLNNLYVFYKFKPTPFLQSIRNLSYEYLRFFDNVCKEYDLTYWLNYGTLLGAVRHNDFVPWDDGLDIGMMRKDYMKLTEIFQSEIKSNNMEYVTCNFKIDKEDKTLKRWFQTSFHVPDFPEKVINIDVYPYDYVKGEISEGFEKKYTKARSKYCQKLNKTDNVEDVIKGMYDELDLSFDAQKYCVPGVEGLHGGSEKFKFQIMETDELFPLQKGQFGEYEFPIPYNSQLVLQNIYGKRYMKIPRKFSDHDLTKYKDIEHIEDIFNSASEIIKRVNDNNGF